MAGRPRTVKPQPPTCGLHELFLRRVKEEMSRLQLSADRQLEDRNGSKLPQRTISDTMGKQADPKLKTVARFATALGIHPWELLVEREDAERMKVSTASPIPAVTKVLIPGQGSQGKTGLRHKSSNRKKE